METIMECAFYVNDAYKYDVVFTEVGPAIRNLLKDGFEHISIGHLDIFEGGKYLYECVIK